MSGTATRVALTVCVLSGAVPAMAQQRLTSFVDSFIGTGGHGHTRLRIQSYGVQ